MIEKEDFPFVESIAVDLDRTLAYYDTWRGIEHIGEPIEAMMIQVKKWISEGETIKIFTARAQEPLAIPYVKAWLKKHGLPDLEVTNQKDGGMKEFYDDRAFHVIPNTGQIKR